MKHGMRWRDATGLSARPDPRRLRRGLSAAGVALAATLLAWSPLTQARVTKIVIDTKVSPAFGGQEYPAGSGRVYETIAGHLYGELDPNDSHNTIINDLQLAPRNANGKVEYMATFYLVKPIDMSQSSKLMWQDVPNRGGRITLEELSRDDGDIGLSSGWQGDNSGGTAQTPPPNNTNDYAVVPVPTYANGAAVTGTVMGRILNPSGVNSSQIIEHSNPIPYQPTTLDTTQSTLEYHDHETFDGIVQGVHPVASGDWAWASCSASNPFPGTPDPTQICVKGGFVPSKVYQVVFPSKNPYILAVGTAAFRDTASFFKYQTQDDYGTPNPVAGTKWIITRGSSQSGTFVRQLIHFGFTQDESYRTVYDGAWPIVAARRIGLNFRFAKPDLVMKLYEAGAEGPVWWSDWPDVARGLPTEGILDRCTASKSCPKIVEHFGSAEVWGQKLTLGWNGTGADADIPLPRNVYRYYFAGSPHGGGSGGFNENGTGTATCSGTNYGVGMFPTNPMPQTETVNAIRERFRQWVMIGRRPLPSVYPTIAAGQMVHADKTSIGFPQIPAVLTSTNPDAPNNFINSMFDYNWGPDLNYSENIGFHDYEPPVIKQVLPMLVPKTDVDGNEIGGVPVVLREAPLGTYLGWNVVQAGFHQGQNCNYQGGWIPFAVHKADRLANGDPRLSLEERYRSHAGYVRAVKVAAFKIWKQGYLLPADRDALIQEAEASNVLK